MESSTNHTLTQKMWLERSSHLYFFPLSPPIMPPIYMYFLSETSVTNYSDNMHSQNFATLNISSLFLWLRGVNFCHGRKFDTCSWILVWNEKSWLRVSCIWYGWWHDRHITWTHFPKSTDLDRQTHGKVGQGNSPWKIILKLSILSISAAIGSCRRFKAWYIYRFFLYCTGYITGCKPTQ